MVHIIIFSIGLIIGLFLIQCIYNIPQEKSVFTMDPQKYIKNLKIIDIITILATGLIYTMIYARYGLTLDFIRLTALIGFLIVIGFIDYFTTDVYFKTTASAFLTGLILMMVDILAGKTVIQYVFGAAVGVAIIALMVILTKGIGWGDAEIFLVCGIFLGYRLTLIVMIISFTISGITSVLLLLIRKKTKKDYIALGPFIALSAIITILL